MPQISIFSETIGISVVTEEEDNVIVIACRNVAYLDITEYGVAAIVVNYS